MSFAAATLVEYCKERGRGGGGGGGGRKKEESRGEKGGRGGIERRYQQEEEREVTERRERERVNRTICYLSAFFRHVMERAGQIKGGGYLKTPFCLPTVGK